MSVWQYIALAVVGGFVGHMIASLDRRVRYLETRERVLSRALAKMRDDEGAA